MTFNKTAIAEREARIKQREENKKRVLRLSGTSRIEIRTVLNELGLRVPGLFGRLYNAKPLTATQFYQIS